MSLFPIAGRPTFHRDPPSCALVACRGRPFNFHSNNICRNWKFPAPLTQSYFAYSLTHFSRLVPTRAYSRIGMHFSVALNSLCLFCAQADRAHPHNFLTPASSCHEICQQQRPRLSMELPFTLRSYDVTSFVEVIRRTHLSFLGASSGTTVWSRLSMPIYLIDPPVLCYCTNSFL
jgi:hypothetical protein